ncbi:MAG: hypothetical protein ACK5II_03675 [Paracoccus sp. (in: a-proteobacteria)]
MGQYARLRHTPYAIRAAMIASFGRMWAGGQHQGCRQMAQAAAGSRQRGWGLGPQKLRFTILNKEEDVIRGILAGMSDLLCMIDPAHASLKGSMHDDLQGNF